MKRLRVGMYQRYWGGNMDEGWTRFLLEQFAFPYTTLMDADIKKGGLETRFDVIILPDDSTAMITGERPPAGQGGRGGPSPESYPPEYRSGIGADGVAALKAFAQKGGTIVALGGASTFAIERFGLPVRNVVAGRTAKEFFCPGSTLHAKFDTTNPLAYGMPAEGLVVFMGGSLAFEIQPTDFNERYQIIASISGARPAPERLAHRRGVPGEEGGDGLGEARRRPRDARRPPHAAPRPDARHVQAAVQRARWSVLTRSVGSDAVSRD